MSKFKQPIFNVPDPEQDPDEAAGDESGPEPSETIPDGIDMRRPADGQPLKIAEPVEPGPALRPLAKPRPPKKAEPARAFTVKRLDEVMRESAVAGTAGAQAPEPEEEPLDEDDFVGEDELLDEDELLRMAEDFDGEEVEPTPGEEAEETALDAVVLGPAQIGIFTVCLVLGVLLGMILSWRTVLPAAIIALMFSTALQRVVVSLKASRWLVTAWLLGIAAVMYFLILFAAQPLWQKNQKQFTNGIKVLTAWFDKSFDSEEEKAENGEKEAGDQAAPAAEGGITKFAGNLMQGFGEFTEMTRGFRIFLQLICFSAALLYLPILVVSVCPGLGKSAEGKLEGFYAWLGAGCLKVLNRSGQFSLVRLVKALLIGFLTAIGLQLAGITAWWFIAGCVAVVALICNLSPLLAAFLGALMLLAAPNSTRGIVGLALTTIVLVLAERRLHWYLYLMPMAKRYKLPPEMLGQKRAGASGRLVAMLPSLMSILVVVAIGYVVYEFIQVQHAGVKRAEQMRVARQHLANANIEEAVASYQGLLEKNPDDQEAALGLLRAYLEADKSAEAMEQADRIAKWQPAVISSPLARLRVYMADLMEQRSPRSVDKLKGYKEILQDIENENKSELQRQLGDKILAAKPKSPWGYYAKAQASYHEGDYTDSLTEAERGLEQNSEMLRLLLVKARSHNELKQYDECVEVCDQILGIDPELSEARSLKRLARRSKEETNTGDEPEAAPELE